MPSLSDNLHDEIDEIEELSGSARDIVRARMAELFSVMVEIDRAEKAGEISTGAEVWSSVSAAVDAVVARMAKDMDAITTDAAKRGIAAGKKRVG